MHPVAMLGLEQHATDKQMTTNPSWGGSLPVGNVYFQAREARTHQELYMNGCPL